jgi:glycosyltransferase involved in cell wall biosynthesis
MVSHWLVPAGTTGALFARGRPHVAVAHSGDVHLLGRMPGGARVARWLIRSGARVVFSAEPVAARFARLAPGATGPVVPMGTDVVGPSEPPPSGRFTVLFVGRLVPIKGVATLLEAARALPELRFRIAGDGPLAGRLRAAAPPNVEFLGVVAGTAKRAAFAEAHVICIPSITVKNGRSEGTPVVAAEAIAAGRPIVAARTGGLPEVVATQECMFSPGDARELAAVLAFLAGNSARYASLVAAARERAHLVDWSVLGPLILGAALSEKLHAVPRPTIFNR